MVSSELQQAGGAGGGIGEVGIEEAPAVLHFVVGGEVVPAKAEVEGELVVDLPVVAEVGRSDPVTAAEFADGLESLREGASASTAPSMKLAKELPEAVFRLFALALYCAVELELKGSSTRPGGARWGRRHWSAATRR